MLDFGAGDRPTHPDGLSRRASPIMPVAALVGGLTLVVIGLIGYLAATRLREAPSAARTLLRPTSTILTAVRDLSRLETSELHLEKVIDLTDKQSRFFGLVAATDAILLVAAGDVTIGVDLAKVGENDFVVDRRTGTAELTLPPPEMLAVRLDEERTYVYRRATGLLAKRDEQLESKARQEAVRAIGEAAAQPDVMDKARKQAERQVRQLLEKFGVSDVRIGWRPS